MRARLQKILSEYGICSRRRAEELISSGRVSVNGTAAQPGQTADPETDIVCVDGVPLDRRPEKVVIVLNKPRGYLATASDEHGRKTVLDLVSGHGERLYPVGRLDKQSEGVIFLTNDGEFANAVTESRCAAISVAHWKDSQSRSIWMVILPDRQEYGYCHRMMKVVQLK